MGKTTPFWKAFLKALAFMLVAGAVGPIFLVIYFVTGDDGQPWMLWNGIGWTGVDVIAAFVFALMTTNAAARLDHARTTSRAGVGHIVGVRETGTEINGRRVVEFSLRVSGPRVDEFDTTVTSPMPVIGSAAVSQGLVGVFVDDSGARATIDWEATSLYTGTVPAAFESTEDGRTYDLTGDADALVQIVDLLRRNGIALDSMIDVRERPALRSEVMAIVREHADAPPAADARSLTDRLTELDDLLAGGRITRDEYRSLRSKVIGSE